MAWKNKRGMPAITRDTVNIDATSKVVGRLATQIAMLLMGKHRATYIPHIDTGATVIVSNVDKLVLTGKKMDQKMIFRSSNRPGGIKATSSRKMQEQKPGEILRHAVKYMLPKNRTQAERMKRLIFV